MELSSPEGIVYKRLTWSQLVADKTFSPNPFSVLRIPDRKVATLFFAMYFLFATLAVFFNILYLGHGANFPVRQIGYGKCPISAICFAIDQSATINSAELGEETRFAITIATELGARSPNIEYSAVGFATTSSVIQSSTPDLSLFLNTVDTSQRINGRSLLVSGLDGCFQEVENIPGKRFIVLITDGDKNDPRRLATLIKTIEGLNIITVGVGDGVNSNILEETASSPDFFFRAEFEDITRMIPELVTKICTPAEPPPSMCEKAFQDCDFTFSGQSDLGTFSLPIGANKAFTPQVISKNPQEILGVLNTNGIVPEFILENGLVQPITDFGQQPFTPTHFKPFSIPNTTGSGVGHQVFQANQFEVAKPRCMRIYFTAYQTLFPNTGYVQANLNGVVRSMNKCVVFRTV